jgi:pimeloyl-ACP methyl ester carboxylesterase
VRSLLLACLLFTGCATARPRAEAYVAASSPALPPIGIVFVANGAGDSRSVTDNLGQVLAETGTPLQIETVPWSRGYRRNIADQVDHANHLAHGRRLAALAACYRQTYPDRHIYFIGHSAGAAVLLAAAEMLPPDSIDRIILLAPSVGQAYDLRPALRTARYGIDSFNSTQDRLVLGWGMRIVGTTERESNTAAGQYGFTPVIVFPGDGELYGKLRQHTWDPVVQWSGHDGGHSGSNQTGFLRAYVLPLLVSR